MGTNYYLFTKNRDLVHKHFATEHDWGVTNQEYEIVEYPQLGYQIHVCKLSWGWLPLFQRHKAFKTWAEFEEFYRRHSNHLSLIDEYDHFMAFDDFKTRVFEHAARKPEPVKWEYGCDPIEVKYHPERAIRRLQTVRCEPDEAELWIPFNHAEYFETEKNAKEKFKVYNYYIFNDIKYWNDPDATIDWTEGDFS